MQNVDAFIKIGHSQDVENRIAWGRFVENPYPIVVIGRCDGLMWQERRVHYFLDSSRLVGEWFRPTTEVLAAAAAANAGTLIGMVGEGAVPYEAMRKWENSGARGAAWNAEQFAKSQRIASAQAVDAALQAIREERRIQRLVAEAVLADRQRRDVPDAARH